MLYQRSASPLKTKQEEEETKIAAPIAPRPMISSRQSRFRLSPRHRRRARMMGRKEKSAEGTKNSNDAISHKDSDDRVFFDCVENVDVLRNVENSFKVDVIDEPSSAYAPKHSKSHLVDVVATALKQLPRRTTRTGCSFGIRQTCSSLEYSNGNVSFESKAKRAKVDTVTHLGGHREMVEGEKLTYGTNVDVTVIKTA